MIIYHNLMIVIKCHSHTPPAVLTTEHRACLFPSMVSHLQLGSQASFNHLLGGGKQVQEDPILCKKVGAEQPLAGGCVQQQPVHAPERRLRTNSTDGTDVKGTGCSCPIPLLQDRQDGCGSGLGLGARACCVRLCAGGYRVRPPWGCVSLSPSALSCSQPRARVMLKAHSRQHDTCRMVGPFCCQSTAVQASLSTSDCFALTRQHVVDKHALSSIAWQPASHSPGPAQARCPPNPRTLSTKPC